MTNLLSAMSFLLCAGAAALFPVTRTTGVTIARWADARHEYRLISGHGNVQLARVPFVRATASPYSWESATRLGCTLSRVVIDGRTGWAASAPHSYVIGLFAMLPILRLASWLRRKRRQKYVPSLCRHCGYDLRACHDRCPECGATVGALRIASEVGASRRPL